MAEIKRPNYFTSQFLVEKDFNDEQAYHVGMRRRLNRVLHASGVADGLTVSRVSATQVRVSSGTAIDRQGREIALEDPRTYTLSTAGNDLDVYLTISYGEFLDPADKDTQAGLDKYVRTTERPQLQDGAAAPPTDGSVILLARIRLSASGTIESDGSIDSSVRTMVSARLAPRCIGTEQLADGAVTFAKFATDAVPTAQRIDHQGGTNRIVAQINAGSGVIARSRIETDMATGVVVFSNVLPNNLVQFSDEIDPGLGTGPLCLQLSLDEAAITSAGDANFGRGIFLRSEVDRTSGRFRIFLSRSLGTASAVRVRWHALKPAVSAPDAAVQVGVAISPPAPILPGNTAQLLTATVTNGAPGVTWSGPAQGGGTLSGQTFTTATYTSPGVSGTYQVTATSLVDPTKSATVSIVVTAAITVILSKTTQSLVRGQSVTISGDVINTANKGINWSILNNTGGTLSSASGASTTYTAPAAPGTYTVVATSVADPTKSASCVITVTAVDISVTADSTEIIRNSSTTVRAQITPGFADKRATWQLHGPGQLTTGPSATATYTAPNFAAIVTAVGTSVADPSKSNSVVIEVIAGVPDPGPGKLIPVEENLVPESGLPADARAGALAESDAATAPATAAKKPRTFIRPQRRVAPQLPEPGDE
jgi:hypothetical protein